MKSRQRQHVKKIPGKHGHYHHGDLREALVAAALQMIREGSGEVTLREVARRAGVTHAAPYRHFNSKEALMAAVAEEGFRNMTAMMERRLAKVADDDVVGRLRATGVGYVMFAVAHPAHFKVMFSSLAHAADSPTLAVAGDGTFQMLVRALEACQRKGQVRGGDIRVLASLAWSMVHGLSTLLMEGCLDRAPVADSVEATAARLADELFRGLHASGVGVS